jgi:hypothetical protein
LIFIYGSTNVFLEHLAAWGGAWSATDLEHVSISIMFFGAGLVRFSSCSFSPHHIFAFASFFELIREFVVELSLTRR